MAGLCAHARSPLLNHLHPNILAGKETRELGGRHVPPLTVSTVKQPLQVSLPPWGGQSIIFLVRVWSLQILLASFRLRCGRGLTPFSGDPGAGGLEKELLVSPTLGHKTYKHLVEL